MRLAKVVLAGIVVVLVLTGPCGAVSPVSPQLEWWDVGDVLEVGVDPLTGDKWFSRYRGAGDNNVYRFDEVEWHSYDVPDSVNVLTVDRWGRVWVGGCNWGVFYLENGTFEYIRVRYDPTTPADRLVTGIGFSSEEDMWIGGYYVPNYLSRYILQEDWKSGEGHRWSSGLPDEWGVIKQFMMGPEGNLWFMSGYGVGVVRRPGGDEPLLEGYQTTAFQGGNTGMAMSAEGSFWLAVFPASDGDPDIFYSENGSDWEPVEHPNIPGKTGKAWCAATTGEGVWFSAFYGAWDGATGAGAFWHRGDQWRWFDFGSTRIEDIAVDEATGDVWFATLGGPCVLRGGPDAWPPVWIELEADVDEARCVEAFSLMASAGFQMELGLDLYVAVQLPDGSLFFAPNWSPTMAPYVPNLSVPIGMSVERFPLIDFDMTGCPEGTYRWFAACTHAGTMDSRIGPRTPSAMLKTRPGASWRTRTGKSSSSTRPTASCPQARMASRSLSIVSASSYSAPKSSGKPSYAREVRSLS